MPTEMPGSETPEERQKPNNPPPIAGPPTPPTPPDRVREPQSADRERGGGRDSPTRFTEMAKRKARQAIEKIKMQGERRAHGPRD